MDKEVYKYYEELKKNAKESPWGKIADSFVEDFLKAKPDREQFIDYMNGLNNSSPLLWALWSIKNENI